MATHRTAPDHNETGWPKGVPYIIGNEGCERFSFYGMKAILYVYLTYLLTESGMLQAAAEKQATATVHTFVAGVYALPMIGALIADRLLGKYPTIIVLSLVYCAGHACLAMFEGNFTGFAAGLVLIAIGSGGIKPCVSAHVGDQFGRGNWHRVQKVYMAFYFIINFGSFFSTIAIPYIKETLGYSVAFAIPGVLMFIATIFFWMGRNVFVHVPPSPGGKLGFIDVLSGMLLFMVVGLPMFGAPLLPAYAELAIGEKFGVAAVFLALGMAVFGYRQKLEPDDGFLAILFYTLRVKFGGSEDTPLPKASGEQVRAVGADVADNFRSHSFWGPAARRFGQEATEGPVAVLKILGVFAMVSVFWALFDQHASSWVEQARAMDRTINLGFVSFTMLPSQVSAANPILVMMLIPLMGWAGYPFMEKVFRTEMTPLKRMTIGMFVASLSFVIVALNQQRLDDGESVSIGWQLLAYVVITLAEVMVSITGLEFAYTQAPKRMKSLIMGFWLFAVAVGNVLVVFLAGFEGLPWVQFFWIFAGLMAGAAVIFGGVAYFYRYKTYTQ